MSERALGEEGEGGVWTLVSRRGRFYVEGEKEVEDECFGEVYCSLALEKEGERGG